VSIDSRRFQKTPTRKGDVVPSKTTFTQTGMEKMPMHESIVRRMEPNLNRPPSGVATLSGAPFRDAAPGAVMPPKTGKNKKVPQGDLSSAAQRKLMGK
jgi:hypothetical protein